MRHVKTERSSSDLSVSHNTEITGTDRTQGLHTLMVGLPLPPDHTEVSITPSVSLRHFSLETELKPFQLQQVGGVNVVPPLQGLVSLTTPSNIVAGRGLLEDLHFTIGLSESGGNEDRHAGSPPHGRAVTTLLGLPLCPGDSEAGPVIMCVIPLSILDTTLVVHSLQYTNVCST